MMSTKHSTPQPPSSPPHGPPNSSPPSSSPRRCYRNVIRISAEDSPNVRLAFAQMEGGRPVDYRTLIPGILSYREYVKRRETWDPVLQCIGLDGMFWKGKELLLFPPIWLNMAEQLDRELRKSHTVRRGKAIGIDPAQGGDKTAMACVDDYGLIELVSRKTPNTADIRGEAIAFGQRHGVEPHDWIFDAGGGGAQHADYLREDGYNVRTVAFGESVTPPLKVTRRTPPLSKRVEIKEEKYSYVNRRAEMYGSLHLLLDPTWDGEDDEPVRKVRGFSIPAGKSKYDDPYTELRRQLAVMPKLYDSEGRLRMLSKTRKPGQGRGPKAEPTLEELLGCSPDEADALVLAVYGLRNPGARRLAGAAW